MDLLQLLLMLLLPILKGKKNAFAHVGLPSSAPLLLGS